MKGKVILALVVILFVCSAVALADWDQTMPAKWVQLPDLTNLGIDVNASQQFILADDFRAFVLNGDVLKFQPVNHFRAEFSFFAYGIHQHQLYIR